MFCHIDADAFFASVLMRKHPQLIGKPLFALGMGGGCIIAASYEAKAKGVRTGMRVKEARKLCPGAIEMASDFAETGLASRQIEELIEGVCPRIEKMSVDEWFLDLTTLVGGVPKDIEQWAIETRETITKNTAISVSVGVAPTKILAKMASEYRKPGGVTVVIPQTCSGQVQRESEHQSRIHTSIHSRRGASEQRKAKGTSSLGLSIDHEAFLRDRPAAAIPGIGKKREVYVRTQNWVTAWDVANANAYQIQQVFGKPGVELCKELLGEKIYDIAEKKALPKSVSRARSFRKTQDKELLWAHMLQHMQYLVLKMRRPSLACGGISVWVRDEEYKHHGEHIRLPQELNTEEALHTYVKRAFEESIKKAQMYTQTGLSFWNLHIHTASQPSLFDEEKTILTSENLQHALDAVRKTFGRKMIHRGSALSVSTGTERKVGSLFS